MSVSLSIDAVAGEWIAAGEALVRELGQDNLTLDWVCVQYLGWDAGAVEMILSGWGVAWTQPRGLGPQEPGPLNLSVSVSIAEVG